MAQKYMSLNHFSIVTIGKKDYRINFWFITKSEGVDRMKKLDLSEKSGQL